MSDDLIDDLTTDLRAQMRAATSSDSLPPGFPGRVHAGARRRRAQRVAVAGSALVVAGIAGAAALAAPPSPGPAQRYAVESTAAPAPRLPGPTDAELRSAEWFHYESTPVQPDVEREAESRWEARDGRHYARQPDGSLELYDDRSRFAYGPAGSTFAEVLALPADPVELAREMRAADGGRPPEERVFDQVRQLLGRSPALLPVRKALVEAASGQDGAALVDGARDSRGRPALLLRRTDRDGAVLSLFVDPGSYRLLEERTTAGPGFPAPPTAGPVPSDAPSYRAGQLLYQETWTLWSTTPPPGTQ